MATTVPGEPTSSMSSDYKEQWCGICYTCFDPAWLDEIKPPSTRIDGLIIGGILLAIFIPAIVMYARFSRTRLRIQYKSPKLAILSAVASCIAIGITCADRYLRATPQHWSWGYPAGIVSGMPCMLTLVVLGVGGIAIVCYPARVAQLASRCASAKRIANARAALARDHVTTMREIETEWIQRRRRAGTDASSVASSRARSVDSGVSAAGSSSAGSGDADLSDVVTRWDRAMLWLQRFRRRLVFGLKQFFGIWVCNCCHTRRLHAADGLSAVRLATARTGRQWMVAETTPEWVYIGWAIVLIIVPLLPDVVDGFYIYIACVNGHANAAVSYMAAILFVLCMVLYAYYAYQSRSIKMGHTIVPETIAVAILYCTVGLAYVVTNGIVGVTYRGLNFYNMYFLVAFLAGCTTVTIVVPVIQELASSSKGKTVATIASAPDSIDATLTDPVASKCYRGYCRNTFGTAWLPRIHAEISRILSDTALFDVTDWHGIEEVAAVRTVMAAFYDMFLDSISMTNPAIDVIVDQIARLLDALDNHAERLLAATTNGTAELVSGKELTRCAGTVSDIRAQLMVMQGAVHEMMAIDFDHFIRSNMFASYFARTHGAAIEAAIGMSAVAHTAAASSSAVAAAGDIEQVTP